MARTHFQPTYPYEIRRGFRPGHFHIINIIDPQAYLSRRSKRGKELAVLEKARQAGVETDGSVERAAAVRNAKDAIALAELLKTDIGRWLKTHTSGFHVSAPIAMGAGVWLEIPHLGEAALFKLTWKSI